MVFGKETELKKDIFSKERDDIILPLMGNKAKVSIFLAVANPASAESE